MTTKRIVYSRPDGGVSVVCPAPRARLPGETDDEFIARIRTENAPLPEETEDEFIARIRAENTPLPAETEDEFVARIRAKDVPSDAANIEVMEFASLPSSREFRNAWEKPGFGAPTVNMPKARGIHAERIAVAQAAALARLKVEERKERLSSNTAKADEHAATITALEALDLNVLATQIANAPNPTALSAIWPANVPR